MTIEQPDVAPADSRIRRLIPAVAGPVAIVSGVIIVLHNYAGAVPVGGDIRPLWVPSFCYLGDVLRSGAIPMWDPHIIGGAPMAADPQPFGWLYLLPMVFFTALPCAVAVTAMMWSLSTIAGLSCYWFVRLEGGSRPAATVGGLILSLLIAGSDLSKSWPISAAVALGMLFLASLAWMLQGRTTASWLLRSVVVGLAASQIVAAHMSVGMMIVPLAASYVLAKAIPEIASGRRRTVDWAKPLAIAGLASVLISMGLLLPRAAYVPESTLGKGYDELLDIAEKWSGSVPSGEVNFVTRGPTAELGWPLEYGTGPGSYAGACGLLLAGAALWSRRRRPLILALAASGVLFVVLPWSALANLVASIRGLPLSSFYLHQPHRLGYNLVIVIALLAAIGLETWMQATPRVRPVMLVPGTLFLALAIGAKGGPTVALVAIIGWAAAVAVLALAARRARPVAIPVLVAVELVFVAVGVGHLPANERPAPGPMLVFNRIDLQRIATKKVIRPTPVVKALKGDEGRYMAVGTGRSSLLWHGANLFNLEYAGGYSSAQPLRFWTFLRAATGKYVHYNRAFLPDPPDNSDIFIDLLDVTHLVAAKSREVPGAEVIYSGDDLRVYALARESQRVSLVTDWMVAADSDAALESVVDPRFDPQQSVVLESEPQFGEATGINGDDAAKFTWLDDQSARVEVTTSEPAILLVRNTYDDNWQATVDGRPTDLLPANYVAQGVPIPPGTHTVQLQYRDPTIIAGLWISVSAIAALLGAGLLLRRRGRVAKPRAAETTTNVQRGSAAISGRA